MPYQINPYYEPYAVNSHLPWREFDDFVLRSQATTTPTPDIARLLRRTIAAVYARASFLGITLLPPDPPFLNPYLRR